ncbi:integrase [Allocatelliglobosispora scoriae]|uniref:Integrase n=1 Tax=Allocatelliglobosispora scoriae TaxID=643052 RepID=A0A841BWL5_9ACTN|nr:tyrosine-type recombinase/integrase [Allocatelliglobosispora scoriae]MBB5871152.1 integrase [Allocatelliglobosispora scoriae]
MPTVTAAPDEDPPGRRARSRRNGEGSIRQRKDGRWEARVWVFSTDGSEVRRSVYGDSWDEAHEAMIKLQSDKMAGVRIPASADTVGDYLAYWLSQIAEPRVRPSTMASYRWLITTYVLPYLGSKKLARLRPADIRTFLNRLKGVCQCCALGKDKRRVERGQAARCCALTPRQCCEGFLSDGSVRYAHRLVRAALQDAIVDELIATNPARHLRISHRYRPKFTPWSADEARSFLKVAREDRWYALYSVALALGLRRGEALGLRWVDVDLIDNVISIRRTLQRVNGQLTNGPVKTESSDRKVGVPAALARVLTLHKAEQARERKIAKKWTDHGMVFTTKLGTPIEPRNLNRHFDQLCERAGVPRIRFHDLRHSCATILYDQGVPIENIQDVLGHSSPTITKTIYVEATRKIQRDAVDRLDFLFDD